MLNNTEQLTPEFEELIAKGVELLNSDSPDVGKEISEWAREYGNSISQVLASIYVQSNNTNEQSL